MVKTTTKESEDMKEEEKRCKEAPEEEEEAKKEFPEKDEESEEDKKAKKKKKAKKEVTEDEEDVEKEDEEDEDDVEKGDEAGQSPEEDTASATDAGSSTSPNMGVPSTQNVFVPQTGIKTGRDASTGNSAGVSPSEVSYGKSAKTDLMKSPLFVEMTKSINGMQSVIAKKLEAVEKSFTARIENMQKTLKAVEKFYNTPFYKAHQEIVGPEGTIKKTIKEQIKDGEVRFR